MLALVAVGQQAVVAGRLAALAWRPARGRRSAPVSGSKCAISSAVAGDAGPARRARRRGGAARRRRPRRPRRAASGRGRPGRAAARRPARSPRAGTRPRCRVRGRTRRRRCAVASSTGSARRDDEDVAAVLDVGDDLRLAVDVLGGVELVGVDRGVGGLLLGQPVAARRCRARSRGRRGPCGGAARRWRPGPWRRRRRRGRSERVAVDGRVGGGRCGRAGRRARRTGRRSRARTRSGGAPPRRS